MKKSQQQNHQVKQRAMKQSEIKILNGESKIMDITTANPTMKIISKNIINQSKKQILFVRGVEKN